MRDLILAIVLIVPTMFMAADGMDKRDDLARGVDLRHFAGPKEDKKTPKKEVDLPLEGVYTVLGRDGDNEYGGTCVIAKFEKVYVVQWITVIRHDDGISVGHASGIGLRKGDVLAVSWGDAKSRGCTMYEIKDGGKRLEGSWTSLPGNGTVRDEVLTRTGAIPTAN